MFSSLLQSVKATAYDLGQQYVEHTGKAVDYGFLLTVEKAKQAVEYTGVAEYASKAIEATNNVIISSGLDEYTSKAVDATGKAVQYTAQKASESRVTEKVFEVTEKAASASYEYTKKAIDLTVDGTKKVVDVTGKAFLEQNVLDSVLGGFKDEIYSITQDSSELVLKSLYPNWNGGGNGTAEVLGSFEEAWALTGHQLTQQQMAAQRTEQAVLSLLARLNAQHEGWRQLSQETATLPALCEEIAALRATTEQCIAQAEALSTRIVECEAAAVQAEFVAARDAAAKRAAAREERHQRQVTAAINHFRSERQPQLQPGVWMIGGDPGEPSPEDADDAPGGSGGAGGGSAGAGAAAAAEEPGGDDSYLEETGGIVMPGLRQTRTEPSKKGGKGKNKK